MESSLALSLDLSVESATRVWDEIAVRLDDFLTAWVERDSPPAIADFLPAHPAAVRRLMLEELVKADLEQRARVGLLRPLDEYIADFPELAVDREPPVALIYEDFHVRVGRGENVTAGEYLSRYPRHADALRNLLKLNAPRTEASVRRTRAHEQLAAGEQVDDFQLLASVGRGAFASVFLARQLSMQRLVALKVSADRGLEHQTLAQLDHPHIVRVYDQRTLPDRGLRLLYMQFAAGGTLQDVVEALRKVRPPQRTGRIVVEAIDAAMNRVGQLPPEHSPIRRRLTALSWPETVCRLAVPLAQALDYAHREGILHRDVKPANVLLSGEGAPKLADFNISFASPLQDASPAAYFGGSLAYMSPEQLEASHPRQTRRPEDLDARSDLYSLAVLLWELLHGERPFRDEGLCENWSATVDSLLERRCTNQWHVPPDASDDVMAERLRRVLMRTLDADPNRRPASGAQLARELYLCSQPQAWDLLFAPARGLREFLGRHPVLAYALAIMPPNILAGYFNYWYNERAIIEPLGEPAYRVFYWVIGAINGLAFPVGLAILLLVVWPLARAVRGLERTPKPTESELTRARRRALRMGHLAAQVGIVEWFVAGFAFPLCMHWGLGYFPMSAYVHFFFSMVVCGAVAAAFPFFAASDVSLRVFYPALLGQDAVDENERRSLLALGRHAIGYLIAASGVPLLGLLLLVGSGIDNRLAALLLIVVGLAGTAVALFAHNRVRRITESLATATRPVDFSAFDTESRDM
ncbi:MAG: serine/threonine-protein kinase [Pirellulales bacterium]